LRPVVGRGCASGGADFDDRRGRRGIGKGCQHCGHPAPPAQVVEVGALGREVFAEVGSGESAAHGLRCAVLRAWASPGLPGVWWSSSAHTNDRCAGAVTTDGTGQRFQVAGMEGDGHRISRSLV